MKNSPVLFAAALVWGGALNACTTTKGDDRLRARAAFDLACDAGDLEVTTIDKRTRGVEGCGQRAAYVKQCQACANGYPACECTWLINGDGRASADAAPGAGGAGQAVPGPETEAEPMVDSLSGDGS